MSDKNKKGARGFLPGGTVNGSLRVALAAAAFFQVSSALASELSDMLGKWRWQKFTIEVKECSGRHLCATVIAGPKNVGMEIFASQLIRKNDDWFGQIVDPETRATYYTRMRFTDKAWQLDGCTPSKICLSGAFIETE